MPSTNPYRYDSAEANATANSIGPRDVYHREAHGLTGEMFDACLREQFTAGADVGAREAWDEARRMMREQSARAWDEGYGQGQIDGRQEAWAKAGPVAMTAIRLLGEMARRANVKRETRDALEACGKRLSELGDELRA